MSNINVQNYQNLKV